MAWGDNDKTTLEDLMAEGLTLEEIKSEFDLIGLENSYNAEC